ncbi:hypothetical protein F5148DRAFT_1150313 [Russula earlei]|uniref:Uncharacterized protein n=1 Tax=Russula earlei TaxID=71964 RepID=A0ACC0U5U8_9AGAM|nr:hypothetical protein F5148DRAFT_1150313 [Russula earlei]
MKKTLLLLSLFFVASCAHAQLLSWQFGSPASNGDEVSFAPTYANPHLTASSLVRGNGLLVSGFVRGFSAIDFTLNGAKADAIANNDYFQTGFTVGTGYTASVYNIDAHIRRSSSVAANAYRWMYSLDGTSFTEIGTADVAFTTTTADGDDQVSIIVSNIAALQSLPANTNRYPAFVSLGRYHYYQRDQFWQFGSPAALGSETTYGATFTATNVTTSSLSRGPGIPAATGTSLARGFTAANFMPLNSLKSDAITNGNYYQFTIAASTALQNVPAATTVTFRLYAWGSTTTTGTFAIGRYIAGSTNNSLEIQGSVAIPTPLSLLDFEAVKTPNTIALTWETVNERGGTAQSFDAIGTVTAKNTAGQNEYAYTDKLNNAPVYYRLKMLDKDGSYTYSKVVAVTNGTGKGISVYPNPVVNSCTIEHPAATPNASMVITGVDGRTLMVQPVPGAQATTTISLANLAKGSYWITFSNNVLNSIIILLFITSIQGNAQAKKWDSTYKPASYDLRVAQFRMFPNSKKDIIFLGNSITAGVEWQELLGNPNPAKVFILIGINDVALGIPDSITSANHRRMVQYIKAHSPATKIYLQTLLPVNKDFGKHPAHYNKDEKIIRINENLKQLAKEENVELIDLYTRFLDSNGKLIANYTYDGLHLTAAGYQHWAEVLKEYHAL